jgi:hypothetical protein
MVGYAMGRDGKMRSIVRLRLTSLHAHEAGPDVEHGAVDEAGYKACHQQDEVGPGLVYVCGEVFFQCG